MMPNGCRHYSIGHTFDPISGWCIHGCGVRDDGRIVKVQKGEVASGPAYTAEQLQEFQQKASTQ